MNLRWKTVSVALASVLALLGCGSARTGGDAFFAQAGETRTSPSGEFTATLHQDDAKGFAEYRPVILDASGQVVWKHDTAFVERYFPGVAWEQDADILWVLSADVGDSHVGLVDGARVQVFGEAGMPADIAKAAGK